MAMGRAVVASVACAQSIEGVSDRELVTAAEPAEYVERIDALLRDTTKRLAMGAAARQLVLRRFTWAAHLSGIDAHLGARAVQPALSLLRYGVSHHNQ
jgi:glycosyltransferase involved in cell wall biosynthesis